MITTKRHKISPWEEKPRFPDLSAHLLESATGTGKTFTTGKIVNELWNFKQKYNNISQKVFPDFNILVLNDRIWLVEQLRDEFVDGIVNDDEKTIKPPILSDDMISQFWVSTYHSQYDDIQEGKSSAADADVEVIEDTTAPHTERIHFSTLQTAKLEKSHAKIWKPNIIIIDEADIITIKSQGEYGEFMTTLMSYYEPDDDGYYPVILPITATPDNITKTIFGTSKATFWLGEYLAHPDSPKVNMYFETPPWIDRSIIATIHSQLSAIKSMLNEDGVDYKEVRKKIADIKESITNLLPDRQTDIQKKQYLTRALDSISKKIQPEHRSLIFNNKIQEAKDSADILNTLFGKTVAQARHSETKEDIAQTLQWLKDGTTPIVTSVGQLIRGIDIPAFDNVFSLINTDSAKKYLQIFWRGMRGEEISFYDYGGSFENMVWLATIYNEFKKARSAIAWSGWDSQDNLTITIDGQVYDDSISHTINLFEIIVDYQDIESQTEKLPIDKLKIITLFTNDNKTIADYKDMKKSERKILFATGILAWYDIGRTTLPKIFNITGDCVGNKEIRYQTWEQIFVGEKIEIEKLPIDKLKIITLFTNDNKTIADYKDMTWPERKELFATGMLAWYDVSKNTLPKLFDITGDCINNKEIRYQTLEQIFVGEKIEIEKLPIDKLKIITLFTNDNKTIADYKDMTW